MRRTTTNTSRSETLGPDRSGAAGRLHQEFADVAAIRSEHPEVWAVDRELVLRANRDAAVAAVVNRLTAGWRASIRETLDFGCATGEFRADLNVDQAADVVLGALWGAATLLCADAAKLAAMADGLLLWFAPPAKQRS